VSAENRIRNLYLNDAADLLLVSVCIDKPCRVYELNLVKRDFNLLPKSRGLSQIDAIYLPSSNRKVVIESRREVGESESDKLMLLEQGSRAKEIPAPPSGKRFLYAYENGRIGYVEKYVPQEGWRAKSVSFRLRSTALNGQDNKILGPENERFRFIAHPVTRGQTVYFIGWGSGGLPGTFSALEPGVSAVSRIYRLGPDGRLERWLPNASLEEVTLYGFQPLAREDEFLYLTHNRDRRPGPFVYEISRAMGATLEAVTSYQKALNRFHATSDGRTIASAESFEGNSTIVRIQSQGKETQNIKLTCSMKPLFDCKANFTSR
jgi:hypothetical protein